MALGGLLTLGATAPVWGGDFYDDMARLRMQKEMGAVSLEVTRQQLEMLKAQKEIDGINDGSLPINGLAQQGQNLHGLSGYPYGTPEGETEEPVVAEKTPKQQLSEVQVLRVSGLEGNLRARLFWKGSIFEVKAGSAIRDATTKADDPLGGAIEIARISGDGVLLKMGNTSLFRGLSVSNY